MNKDNVPVFILCGGLGTRLREQTEFRPKPMVPIGRRPVLWHIMTVYAHYGFCRFVLCIGHKSEMIRQYFLDFYAMNSDVTVELATNNVTIHTVDHACDWTVTLAYTGENTMTGARLKRAAERHLGDAEHFAVTYGDGLTDADLDAEWRYHLGHNRLGTVLSVNPASRFGEFRMDGSELVGFVEKPDLTETWINGGFFLFRRGFLDYLPDGDDCILERTPLARLAEDGELNVFRHRGYWACMDTQRDHDMLQQQWNGARVPWAPFLDGAARD